MPSQLLTPSLILSEVYQQRTDIVLPTRAMLSLPEKVVQFGTGGFLRAFADFFIDEANRAGLFGGRIVMVGSTGSGRAKALNDQGGLYTLRIQGLERGDVIEKYQVVGSVSRALSAKDEWDQVLACARDPQIELVISNTTEVGISYDPDDTLSAAAPNSFPGKLTAFLYERAQTFEYDIEKGLVVLPCELVEGNGAMLREIVFALAHDWKLPAAFIEWIENAVTFCNTLVDRIVPGTPTGAALDEIESKLRYEDALVTTAEVYRLWPIEAPEAVQDKLGFAAADPAIILTDDVTPFRERKIRILNGAHTTSVALSFLCGEETVLSMMRNPLTGAYVRTTMMEEIVPSLDVEGGHAFAEDVLDRFGNPFLRHRLIDITLQSTSKWRLRLLPTIRRYHEKKGVIPDRIALGFAAYLVFMRGVEVRGGAIYGERNGIPYQIKDDQAGWYMMAWQDVDTSSQSSVHTLVKKVCSNEDFWGAELQQMPAFVETVADLTWQILSKGAEFTLSSLLKNID